MAVSGNRGPPRSIRLAGWRIQNDSSTFMFSQDEIRHSKLSASECHRKIVSGEALAQIGRTSLHGEAACAGWGLLRCFAACHRIMANGIHHNRSLVRIVKPKRGGNVPRNSAPRNPIGPKTLPSNPTNTIGQ